MLYQRTRQELIPTCWMHKKGSGLAAMLIALLYRTIFASNLNIMNYNLVRSDLIRGCRNLGNT